MATTSLTMRVSSRLPFQTLAPEETSATHTDRATSAIEPVEAPSHQTSNPFSTAEATPRRATDRTLPYHPGIVTLLVVENLSRLLQPLAIGLAIDGLMNRSFGGLVILLGLQLAYMLISTIRQTMDSRQLNEVINIQIDRMKSATVESPLRNQASWLQEYLRLVERTLPEVVRITVGLCGTLLLLVWYDWTFILLCLGVTLPVMLLATAGGRKSQLLARQLSQLEEGETEVLAEGDFRSIRQHFQRYDQARRQLAQLDTSSFCLSELFVTGLLATSLVHYCLQTSALPGDIVAVVMYVLWFLSSLNSIPVLLQHLPHMRAASP